MLRSWLGVVAAMFVFLMWSEPAHAQGFDPLGAAQQAAETKPSADEAAAQERLARLQAKMGKDKVEMHLCERCAKDCPVGCILGSRFQYGRA